MINAIKVMIVHPSITNGMRYQPSTMEFSLTTAISAVAPAGGWTVPVRAIALVAMEHDKAPAIHRTDSKSELSWKSLLMVVPMTEASICESMTFLGWASGEFIAWNSSTAAAPCTAINFQYTASQANQFATVCCSGSTPSILGVGSG
jgi:hypothetical protein